MLPILTEPFRSATSATLPPPDELPDAIAALKRARNAVLLAHYYQDSEIQDAADFLGDSLQLARAAASTNADVIVFAGVHFMAETAKILNPEKIVVVPDLEAGCSLADACPADAFRAWRARYPGHAAVSYINCSAEVKAMSDVIVTSSNAEKVVRGLPGSQPILFAPDRHLGAWVQKRTGRDMKLWQGTCVVHITFSERALIDLKVRHPGAEVIAHPECDDAVLRHADIIGSTSRLLSRVTESPATEFIVATEAGILHQMKRAAPHKTFFSAPGQDGCACNVCPHMKRNSLEKIYACLRDLAPRIDVAPEIRAGASRAIERMFELTGSAS
jgi:quinolinate synthase